MSPVLGLPRARAVRWPVAPFLEAVGAADLVALARVVHVPLVVVQRAARRGLDLGQAESWCRFVKLDPVSVWPLFLDDEPGRADEQLRGRRWDLAPVLADLPADVSISETAKVLGIERSKLLRWLDRGVLTPVADRVAIARGVHPSYFWPEWGAA